MDQKIFKVSPFKLKVKTTMTWLLLNRVSTTFLKYFILILEMNAFEMSQRIHIKKQNAKRLTRTRDILEKTKVIQLSAVLCCVVFHLCKIMGRRTSQMADIS